MSKKSPIGLKFLIATVVVVSVLLWLTVPKYRYNKLMEDVSADLARRHFTDAESNLKSALKLKPKSREAVLLLSDVMRMESPMDAFSLLYGAFQRDLLEPIDYPMAAILGYEVREFERAEEIFLHADSTFALVPRLATVRALRSLVEGDIARCRELLEESIALDDAWAPTYYWKGQLLRNSPSRIDHIKGKQALVTASEMDDFDGLRACFALADSRNMALSSEEKIGFLKRAQAHQWASDEWQLFALSALAQIDSENRDAYIEEAVSRFSTLRPKLLGNWLNRVGEFERALDFLPDNEEVLNDPDLFNERFMALSLSGQVDEAESLLKGAETPQNSLQKASRLFVLSMTSENRERTIEQWEAAFSIAEEVRNEDALVFLSKNALRIAYFEGAKKGYEALFQEDFEERASAEVWTDRLTAELYAGDFEESLRVARAAVSKFPSSILLLNNMLYLELLAEDYTEESVEKFSTMLPPLSQLSSPETYGATLAFARLKQGRYEEAKMVVDQILGLKGLAGTSDSTEVVVALVYAAVGEVEAAIQVAGRVDKEKVLPQEWLLISSLRTD